MKNKRKSERTMMLRSPRDERLLKMEAFSARMVAVVASKINGKRVKVFFSDIIQTDR